MPRKADANQAAIVLALRQAGCLVLDLHTLGHGAPDLLCQGPNGMVLLECKSLGGRLTLAELRFMDQGWLVRVVWNPGQALEAVGLGAVGAPARQE